MRKQLVAYALVLFTPACLAVPPDAIVIMKSEGDYLNILPDGSANAGFGTLRPCATVAEGTFDFALLLQSELAEEQVIRHERRTAATDYISVGFSRNGSARMYHFANRLLIEQLLQRAERNARIIDPDVACPFPAAS